MLKTIKDNPHIFKIVTPINVYCFEQLLVSHPNGDLVSVCWRFWEGFWPLADTVSFECLLYVDNSFLPLSNPSHITFVQEQRDFEIALDHFSPAFGPDLLRGIMSVPIGVVPKLHSNKLHLVVDQNLEDYSPNSLIACENVNSAPQQFTCPGSSTNWCLMGAWHWSPTGHI